MEAVAANAPVFFLHPRERYFPCSVEWFLERAELCITRNVMLRHVVQDGELLSDRKAKQDVSVLGKPVWSPVWCWI